MAKFNKDLKVGCLINCRPERYLREALIKGNLLTYTTGDVIEPAPLNYTQLTMRDESGKFKRFARFGHPGAGLFVTELFSPRKDEIHAFFQFHYKQEWMTRLENRRTISYDGGRNWTPPEPLPDGINNLWIGKGIIYQNKRWMWPASFCEVVNPEVTDNSNVGQWMMARFDFRCCVIFSDDEGKSFIRSVSIKSKERHLIEPRIVELSDGSILMLIRSMDSKELFRSVSKDGGRTWSEAVPGGILNPSSKSLLLRHPNGNIVLVHNPSEKRNKLAVWVSDDDAETWKTKYVIAEDNVRNLNYPDGDFDENGNLNLIWENGRSVYSTVIPAEILK